MSDLVDVREVERFFFEASLNGYMGAAERRPVSGMPGYKEVSYARGDFLMTDRWSKTPGSNKSAGTKTILFKDIPVWWMSYAGWYDEAALPFLKQVLVIAYRAEHFVGGRGISGFRNSEGTMTYLNHVELESFLEFRGYETIVDEPLKRRLGSNYYYGMSLL